MSIAALPPQAVHAIGSAQVLTDSASLVKELVDNALDAQATSITVELSTNALDVIQVKDNGHGIAPADRALVCRRNCTSKIKDLDDLANIGGASLGFRGEALASTVEMSGSVVIRTRIIGEATAVSLKVSCNGEVEKYKASESGIWTLLMGPLQRGSSVSSRGDGHSRHRLPTNFPRPSTDCPERPNKTTSKGQKNATSIRACQACRETGYEGT